MSNEILSLNYDATHQSVLVRLPAMRAVDDPSLTDGVTHVRVMGAPEPTVSFLLSDEPFASDPTLLTDIAALLDRIYAASTSKNDAALADPKALQDLANQNAQTLIKLQAER